ncbi:PilC/PilY family type IV pilus protein [Psychrobacter sp. LV10R520-6]|uniref:PilC/PilY family type IV pilus protein n=1 Tax=Psychrobacter sp. LV10R520-6 TaxID=1415574 RepID=UPI0024CDCD86|nr:PilC/PilY family type IV pilus protein [Psychrobacter sp. LV10R520-6]SNT71391.1 type IV pilus assembly protein PilY1 [Psychrobacter sp. LV10R520-6]
MKNIRVNPSLLRQFRPTAITLAICALMASSVTIHAGTSYDGFGNKSHNKLGDLTIYQASVESNKPTLTLMLDKSGSMRGDYSFSEDIPGLPSYSKKYLYRICSTSRNNNRKCEDYASYEYYLSEPNSRDIPNGYRKEGWDDSKYTLGDLIGRNNQPCVVKNFNNQVVGYSPYIETETETGKGVTFDSCVFNGEKYYDRMSTLKLAILELLAFENVNEDIIMGVGAFGYNRYQGQIRVAAKPLDTTQKNKIHTFLKGLDGSGGTPMSTAFTEAGAYMLGNSSAGGYSSNYFSGMLSTSDSAIVKNDTYIAPETQECGARGVYLLTDGFPNAMDRQDVLKNMMGTALNTSSLSCPSSGGLLQGDSSEGQWQCMGEFAKQLRTKRQVQTAMVGFGAAFNTVDQPANYTSVERTIDKFKDSAGNAYKYNKKYYNCSQISASANPDARNACNLGMESGKYDNVGGYGQGGFYFAKDTKDIVGSVLSVIQDLEADLPSTPAGTITIPQDPLSSLSVKPYAYLPMLEPKVGSDLSIWAGNLKKYNVNQGTLYGQDNNRLYVDNDEDGFPDDLNPDAQDIWSKENATIVNTAGDSINVNDRITAGGFYAQLKAPNETDNSTRDVYLESNLTGKNALVKVEVVDGKLVGFDKLDDSYTTLTKLYLLSFLGYDASPTPAEAERIDDEESGVQQALETIIATPPGDIKVLGGVIHSRPTLVTYGANINATDKDTDDDGVVDADAGMVANNDADRKDYVMFGSMEGALHIASAETGQESFAFIPKTILQNQMAALQPGSTIANAPVFGVDAPWATKGTYKYDFSNTNANSSGEIIAEELYVYGGLRQGGKGLYGLDVSELDKPKMLFSLDATGDYRALGLAWSEPVTGKIQIGSGRNSIKDVIVFGGGYDECYEDPTFRLNANDNEFADCDKTMADGNAVYISDAKTGNVLWSISGRTSGASGKHIQVPEMKHSVVGKITTLDRDDDGMIDHLYFGDLGGQVFRVDLRNGQAVSGSTGINNFTRRVVRVLNVSGDDDSGDIAQSLLDRGLQPRFYGQPSVSFHQDSGVLFAVVNIASGDRSNPLSRLRNDIPKEADRLFGIIDRDIAKQGLYGKDAAVSLTTQGLTLNNLTKLPYNKASMGSKSSVTAAMRPNAATKQGWVYPLNLFDGFNNIKNVKSMGDGLAIGGVYYMTAYSPEMQYDEVSGCAAQVVGGSERQMYCLPYGICEEDKSINGTGGFVRAGKGIQELAFGAFDPKDPTTRILLGTQTLTELVKADDRINYDAGRDLTANGAKLDTVCPGGSCAGTSNPNKLGGSGSGGGEVTSLSYRLFNTRWYEQTAEVVDE